MVNRYSLMSFHAGEQYLQFSDANDNYTQVAKHM